MKINVNDINNLSKSERFDYLRKSKKDLIKIKKSSDINSDIIVAPYKVVNEQIINSTSKSQKQYVSPEQESIFVKVVANTANWIDSQMDLIIPGAWNKSINERKNLIPFLHDHLRTLDARIGDVKDIYGEELPLRSLGIDKEGTTEALIFAADIQKSYNENIFNQYKNKQVTQHSIGLRYIDLVLAINDPDDIDHFKQWEHYINQAINPEKAIELGYFWIVKELKLIENSAVLFGANEITPTLETRNDIQEAAQAPLETEPTSKSLDIDKLIQMFKK